MDEELETAFKDFLDSIDELDTSLRRYCERNIEDEKNLHAAIKRETNTAIKNQNKIWETLR